MEDNSNSKISTTNPHHTHQSVAHDFPGLIRVFTNGHIQRFTETDIVPPSTHPQAPVSSKDITIHPQANISVRLFLPQQLTANNHRRNLPLLIYFHGGAFCTSSPFTATYHNYITAVVAEAKALAVSVNYRLAPEHPIPAAYEDSWAALQWVASHRNNSGPEPWLNDYADFERVFLAGDDAGANIVHNLTMVAGDADSGLGMDILGACMVHPYFWGSGLIGSDGLDPDRKGMLDRLWAFVCPSMPHNDEPWVNPVGEGSPSLAWLGCGRVLVCVAEKDVLKDRGWLYYNALSRSGWMGVAEIEETQGEDHGFHLSDLGCDKAQNLIKALADFFNRDPPPSV